MVIRERVIDDFFLKIDGRWLRVDKKLLSSHPGGSAIITYKNLDASTVFHTFHCNSKSAYKMLMDTFKEQEGTIQIDKIPQEKV